MCFNVFIQNHFTQPKKNKMVICPFCGKINVVFCQSLFYLLELPVLNLSRYHSSLIAFNRAEYMNMDMEKCNVNICALNAKKSHLIHQDKEDEWIRTGSATSAAL